MEIHVKNTSKFIFKQIPYCNGENELVLFVFLNSELE